MNSTRGTGAVRGAFRCGWLWSGLLGLLAVARVLAADSDTVMPRPPQLERDVQFWIRVYTEVDTNGGFLHDQYNLAVVYDTLHFAPSTSPRERERIVDAARNRYVAALRRIAAAKDGPLSDDDQRIKDLWGSEGTPSRLLEATEDIRFQLGQADRFKAGLIRSGAWETHIAETLANLGLPAELAVLPHVESSFNPAAYSKVGAAGLWQFMRSTGRRYMRIDNAVDDRLDPFRSTEAAAQLLAYNYRILGTWPLALTAYNHGAAGVRHAKETVGSDDIVKIVRNYNGRAFGFASRNFYVSFLAALDVDRNPEKYFGPIDRQSEAKFQEVIVPAYVSINSLEHVLKIDGSKLRTLNPALLRSVWDGQKYVPKAYHLRLPIDGGKWTSETLAARLNPSELFAGQPQPRRYRVHKGDTLVSLAEEYGVSAEAIARLNRMRTSAKLRPGRTITLPEQQVSAIAALTPAPPPPPRAPATLGAPSAPPPAAMPSAPPSAQGIAPGSAPTEPEEGIYIVKSGESLADIAAKVGSTEEQLLQLNGIRNRDFVFEGQQLVTRPGVQLPTQVSTTATAGAPGGGQGGAPAGAVPVAVAEEESNEDVEAAAKEVKETKAHGPAASPQPVSAAQAEEVGPALGPVADDVQQSADPTDYSVAKDNTIVVATAETLGHYADWLHVTPVSLRKLNKMGYGKPVVVGRKLKLDFHRVSHEAFEQKRREYHQTLQASYFASHRIVGTEVYLARRGDSMWTITQRFSDVPVWLLEQYNPDLDFADLHPGTQIVMPRVEAVVANGG
ncbi:MAG TPA: LysM peptidoglycan-binding domain-containing protein [Steroidobacteraceae bacterium]|nr:LysM peptidoglycan-binding domain-containing protein [Steroidobacteraceae bacterium]